MATRWIECRYKCTCHKEKRLVAVIARKRAEDIGDFMQRVARAITADHRERSPLCMVTKCDTVEIPMSADGQVGVAEGGEA